MASSVIEAAAEQKQIGVPETFGISVPAAEAAENVKLERFFGTVEKVDELRKTIDIKGTGKKDEKILTFSINERTKITRTKKELNMADLKSGMDVLVEYRKEGDKLIAISIKVSAPK